MMRAWLLIAVLAACGKSKTAKPHDAGAPPAKKVVVVPDAAPPSIDAKASGDPVSAGLPPPTPLEGADGALAFAAAADAIYVVRPGGMCDVWRYTLDGRPEQMVVQVVTPEGACPSRIVIDGNYLLGVHPTEVLAYRIGDQNNGARAMAQGSPEILDVLPGEPGVYAAVVAGGGWELQLLRSADAPRVLATNPGLATRLAVDGSHVYWATDHGIDRIPHAGGDVERFVESADEVTAFVLADDGIYASLYAAIGRAPRAGGPMITLGPAFGECYEVLVHGDHVYWAAFFPDPPFSGVYRMARAGGKVEAVATGLGEPANLAIAGDALYWTDLRRGVTMRQPLR